MIVSNACAEKLTVWGGASCNFITFDDHASVSSISVTDENTKAGYWHICDAEIGLIELCRKSALTDIDISRSRIAHLFVHDGGVLDNILIFQNSICLTLELISADIRERIVIQDSKINDFYFKVKGLQEAVVTNSFIQTLQYNTLVSSTFNLIDCTVILFVMEKTRTGKDSLIQLINCAVNELKFDTVLNLASFNIRSLSPLREGERFKYFKDSAVQTPLTREDLYQTERFKSSSIISILSSDIGKTMFSSNLASFDKFYFANSKIIEAFIAGPRLPAIFTVEGENLAEQRRIAYNQIKKIYENRGDNITAMKYMRMEMEIYREQLRDKTEDKIPGEKFQLFFNQVTNRHGTEWRYPLIVALLLSISLYTVYCICLYEIDRDGDFIWGLIPYYFEFLNPTHKVDFLTDFNLNTNTVRDNFALIIDAVSRVSVPLLLYQMVQAFRKYGKK